MVFYFTFICGKNIQKYEKVKRFGSVHLSESIKTYPVKCYEIVSLL